MDSQVIDRWIELVQNNYNITVAEAEERIHTFVELLFFLDKAEKPKKLKKQRIRRRK